jgi:hypothetical protein
MNPRIKELTEQARAWAETAYKHQNEKFTSHWDNPVGYTVTQFFEQKFAELIVKECAHVAVFKDSGTVATADVAGHMAAGRSIAARLIQEHFGVEE